MSEEVTKPVASINDLAAVVTRMGQQGKQHSDEETLKKEEDSEEESVYSSSTEEELNDKIEPRKEFGLVLTALQSTVKENFEKEERERKERNLEFDDDIADELHSASSVDDNHSVASSDQKAEIQHELQPVTIKEEKVDQLEEEHIEKKDEEKVPEAKDENLEKIDEVSVEKKDDEKLEDNNHEVKVEEKKDEELAEKKNVDILEDKQDTDNALKIEEEKAEKPEEKTVEDTDSPPQSDTTPVPENEIESPTVNAEPITNDHDILPPTPGVAPHRQTFDFSDRHNDDVVDTEGYSENLIALNKIDLKNIKENTLSPRQQEKADEPVLRAIRHLFNNRFMKAKTIFEKQSSKDPLYALGLGSMAFIKAIMTTDEAVIKNAIDVLTVGYSIANAQIDAATKKSVGNTVYNTMSSYYNSYFKFSRNTGGLPVSPKPETTRSIRNGVDFIANGVLRAHVAKAECCLQIAIIQLLQENVMNYIKCGMNLRRAYASYSLVWQEYKRMGQVYHNFIDRDTISGIQFGIGAVHLILSALPQKTLKIVSAFGWKADKHLGFALLKLCVEEKRTRSPMASLVLLAYYTVLSTLCPQILSRDYTQPAIETLLDAQRTFPNSAFFLYYAGRTSRLARNLTLSTQSFSYAIEISKREWAEIEILNMCTYEIGFNYMMEHNWEGAVAMFDKLYKNKYWSPAILRYLTAACYDMMGLRTEAILAYADVPQLVGSKAPSIASIEKYVVNKVEALQDCGYQDMDMCLNAFEFLYLFTGFDFMSHEIIQESNVIVDRALGNLVEAEKTEFSIRTQELLPETPPPKYYNQRGTLLLLKSALNNAMGEHREAIIHLNWIIDHKKDIDSTSYIVPYAYWEAGVTTWGLENRTRSLAFWESALKFTKYDFEFRLSMRVNLAIIKAEEINVDKPEPTDPLKRHQLKKKEPVIVLDSIQSRDVIEERSNNARRKNIAPPILNPMKFNLHI